MKKIIYSLFVLALTAMTFASCEDVPAPYDLPSEGGGGGSETEKVEPKGSGTLEDPFNAAGANEYCSKLESGAESEQDIYVKGIVSSIDENFTTQFGNAKFYISEDGSSTQQFLVYRCLYLGNKKYTSGDLLKEGDEVIVCGKVTNYNGTYETQQNKAFLYSLNGQTAGGGGGEVPGEAKGDGSLQNPFNSVAAANAATALGSGNNSDKAYYIKGKVVSIATDKNGNVQNFDYGTFGNASFYISDDGTESGQFYCYRVLYLGNKKWEAGAGDVLKVGDEVVVCAKLTLYNSTPETLQNEGYLYSLNGKTEGGGGGGTSGGDEGSINAPKTVADALSAIDALEEGATSSANYYVKGKVVKVATAAEDIGPNSSSGKNYKDINYYISDDGSDSKTIYVYRGKNLNNTDFTSADQLKVGDEVVVFGKLQKYKNTKTNEIVPEMAQGNYLVKTNNSGSSSGSGGGGGGSSTEPASGDNGNFEAWSGDTPDNWKTTSSAGNATLSKSTDAHGGSFSCKVAGDANNNKRLGYKELKLSAGTYKITFYAKGLSAGGSVNPGYVPIADGKAGTYKYSGYVDDVNTKDWQKVEVTVELPSDGVYCFVIMNQKKTSGAVDILIDDFTVVSGSTTVIK